MLQGRGQDDMSWGSVRVLIHVDELKHNTKERGVSVAENLNDVDRNK